MAQSPAENYPGTLVSQREFAKRRGCSIQAVNRNTVDHGGVIPTYGARKQVCVEEAERVWPLRTNGAAPPSSVRELDRQRLRKLKADAARSELELAVRRGALVERAVGERIVFAFGRQHRDAWLGWPARIGAELAATLGVEAGVLIAHLEAYVARQLHELSEERFDL